MQRASVVLVFAVATTSCVSAQPAEHVVVPIGIPCRGTVVFPDGSAASGAKVVATTVCESSWAHFVDEALTGEDGSFTIPSFDPTCGKIRFTAEKRDGYWLKTGKEVFYPSPNGTAPEIELAGLQPPEPATIRLGLRGGELEVSVWDESAGRPIHAGLTIECPGAWCGAMSIATGEDGSADTIFVPPRSYSLSLNWYMCGSKTYFSEDRPGITVDVIEGRRQPAVLKVDVSLLSAKASYDNPKGISCRP